MAKANRREVEAVGLDDLAGLGVAVSPAPAGGTVDGRHQVGANQRVEDVLDLPPGQAERGLELAVAGPNDRPGAGLPILRRAEGEQDVDGVAQPRGKAQWLGGLLERGERLSFRDAFGQALEALGNCLHLDVRRRQPAASGRDAGVSHLLRSLYPGPLRHKKLPLALPGAFSLAKLSGSPYLGGASLLDTDFRENPGATRQPGFLIGPSRSSPLCGRSAEPPTKAGSLQGYGLFLW